MSESIIVDTGALWAWLHPGDQHHAWAAAQMERLPPPLLTCEPVLGELSFLLKTYGGDPAKAPELLSLGMVQVSMSLEDEAAAIVQMMRRYDNVPMSLADACLVRLSEMRDRAVVLTTDSDFLIYRRHGRLVIPTLMPPRK